MRSTNFVADSISGIWSFAATAQNLLPYAVGTPDGVVTTGLKVFFESGPTARYRVPGDTGTVTVRNPDGYQNFTAAKQPYHLYDTILSPQETTREKRWEFAVPRSVQGFNFTVRIFTATAHERVVPREAPNGYLISPDSVAKLYAPENQIWSHPRLSGPYPRNIVQVAFTPGTGDEERQSAIDYIGGEVIGGIGGTYYHVQIVDDGSAQPLWRAIDRLRVLPQVQDAGPDVITNGAIPFYLPSTDGPGWRRPDWQVDPDSAKGRNWGAEAVAAPLAWGCETGNVSARVAVVDLTGDHGEWVTSIINRPANDSLDMAGLMWDGQTSLSVPTAAPGQLANALEAVYSSGAHVVNLSWGAAFRDAANKLRLPNPADTADVNRATRFALTYRNLFVQWEQTYSSKPLYVIGAGNYQVDSWFSGFPQLLQDTILDDRVLVVAASTDTLLAPRTWKLWANSGDSLHRGSNFGPLVNIAAPGAGVDVYSATGGYGPAQGTSFAAPHVAAAAGLLKSFDPRLTADEMKTLILNGARNGGRTSGGFPFLNIYESLKAAAQRPGAPLCGNRLWSTGGTAPVLVQRSTGVETIAPSADNGLRLITYHGGRSVRAPSTASSVRRYWSSSWYQTPLDAADERLTSGVTRSAEGTSHGGDTTAALSLVYPSTGISGTPPTAIRVELYSGSTSLGFTRDIPLPALQAMNGSVCVAGGLDFATGGWGCGNYAATGTQEAVDLAVLFAPSGGYLYVVENIFAVTSVSSGTFVCGGGTCHTVAGQHHSRRAAIHRVRLSDGHVTTLWTVPGTTLVRPVLSEAGDELGALLVRRSEGFALPYLTTCEMKFLDIRDGTVKQQGPSCNYPERHSPGGIVAFAP